MIRFFPGDFPGDSGVGFSAAGFQYRSSANTKTCRDAAATVEPKHGLNAWCRFKIILDFWGFVFFCLFFSAKIIFTQMYRSTWKL